MPRETGIITPGIHDEDVQRELWVRLSACRSSFQFTFSRASERERVAVYLALPFRLRFELANCGHNPEGWGARVSSSFAFESRRRKNGKIIAPPITHDNAAMVIAGGRVGGRDEWSPLFTDSGRPKWSILEPARACVVWCARKAHFCNWAMLGCWVNYTTRHGYTFMARPSPPLSRGKWTCAPRTSEIGRASFLLGFRVNCTCALKGIIALLLCRDNDL